MKVQELTLQKKNNLMKDYQNHEKNIMNFFEYTPLDHFDERLEYLRGRSFNRKELVEVLHSLNKKWDASEETLNNIDRLRDEESVVVIGGQQAGLLSGPMYTINKIISIIKLAREQEKKLNLPVIPVFWIAGEDHDFAEINHIHLVNPPELVKHQANQFVRDRTPVSDIALDQKKLKAWVDHLFLQLQETVYSKELYDNVLTCLEKSESYVDFFARFINTLFKAEGLVLVDSNHRLIRKIERDYFLTLIKEQESISEEIFKAAHRVRQAGYELTIEPSREDAHLFYHFHDERVLLTRTEDGLWVGKQEEIKFSTEELIKIAKDSPWKLSNNVVTRPLMQELLFPSLAFVGGWGEISYWSVLKEAFSSIGLKMPPLVPRLSFSYIEPKIAKLVKKYSLNYDDVLGKGVIKERINWLNSQPAYPTKLVAEQLKRDLAELHQPLRTIAENISPNLKELSESNLYLIQEKIDFLVQSIQGELERKYEKTLIDFSSIQLSLCPDNGLQERIFNPVHFLNHYGSDFIDFVLEADLSFKKDHYLVFL